MSTDETNGRPPIRARRFEEKVAFVTGAGRGIGASVVERLAAEGASLACVDVDGDGAESTAAAARSAGADAVAIRCDIADEASVRSAISTTVERWGRLDVLVNMAGIIRAIHSHEETLESFERTIRVNLTGTWLVCREALPHLLASQGNIVNASSTASLSGHPWFTAYGASKAGVHMLTNSLAMEYARQGLRVNSVAPGGITTDMTRTPLPEDIDMDILMRMSPLVPMSPPDTVADAVAFLASDDARFVNGEILRVDGATLA